MNVTVSMNAAEIQESIDNELEYRTRQLTNELDAIFRGKIKTPEQVISVYEKLKQYKLMTGTDYKITFEENTIV